MTSEDSDDGSVHKDHDEETASEGSLGDASSASSEGGLIAGNANTKSQTQTDLKVPRLREGKNARHVRRSTYNNRYRKIFNSTLEDNTSKVLPAVDGGVPGSQIGVTTWSSVEKEILFQKLATLGKDNTPGLAAAIRTKTEAEIRQYILLLGDGALESANTGEAYVISATEIPAACEISQECEDALEDAAYKLSEYQRNRDEEREDRWYGDYWLLTEKLAAKVEADVRAREESDDSQDDEAVPPVTLSSTSQSIKPHIAVPAAELLHLSKWLELSKLFMYRAPGTSEGWPDYITAPKETPSIWHTAFQDFHNLAVSITRRLLQAAAVQCFSRMRLRPRQNLDTTPTAMVTINDVRAATEILGLKSDSREFWRFAPRRNQLRIKAKSIYLQQRWGGRTNPRPLKNFILTYDQVEAELGDDELEVDDADANIETTVEDTDQATDLYADSDCWTDAASSDAEGDEPDQIVKEETDDASGTDSEAPKPRKHRTTSYLMALEKKQDEYTEAFDQQISNEEERRLWNVVRAPAPPHLEEENAELPPPPIYKRKAPSEMKDWRDAVEYEAEWEGGAGVIDGDEFAIMHRRGVEGRKRRKVAYEKIIADLEPEGEQPLRPSEQDEVMIDPVSDGNEEDVGVEDSDEITDSSDDSETSNETDSSEGEDEDAPDDMSLDERSDLNQPQETDNSSEESDDNSSEEDDDGSDDEDNGGAPQQETAEDEVGDQSDEAGNAAFDVGSASSDSVSSDDGDSESNGHAPQQERAKDSAKDQENVQNGAAWEDSDSSEDDNDEIYSRPANPSVEEPQEASDREVNTFEAHMRRLARKKSAGTEHS